MIDPLRTPSRRDALVAGGAFAAALAHVPFVHAQGTDGLQVALVGAGGRGTGAAENALTVSGGPIKLVAMADVFADKLSKSAGTLKKLFPTKFDVPEERKFVGFDGYQKAMDCLKKGDIVILATPPAFRWPMLKYAIEKGLHIFMEKPVTVDGPTTKKIFALADEADKKGSKIAVGLMCRHCDARHELKKRIEDGAIGDILLMRAYRLAQPTATAFSVKKPDGMDELMYQISRFHSFLWASGGAYSDFLIHNIDECCWMKGKWPVKAQSVGGRHVRFDPATKQPYVDQNFDSYATEFTFDDGTKLLLEGRTMAGAYNEFASYAHGTKAACTISASGHTPAKCRIFKGQNIVKDSNSAEVAWKCMANEPSPYQLEWDHFIEAIRADRPYNEAKRGAEASLVTSMGRMAAHTGQVVTYEQMLNHSHEFAPGVAELTAGSPAPVMPDKDGKYPIPEPGMKKKEY